MVPSCSAQVVPFCSALDSCLSSGKANNKVCTYDGWTASSAANQTAFTSTAQPVSGTYRFEVRSKSGTLNSARALSGNVTIP